MKTFVNIFVLTLLSALLQAQETHVIYPNLDSQKELKLCATFTNFVFERDDPDQFLEELGWAIDEYGIDMVNAHHFNSSEWLSYPGYEKLEDQPDQSMIDQYRGYYKRIKDKGVDLVISGGEPEVPSNLFEKYPEMKDVFNGKFWQFIEDKTRELYDVIPEMDCFELYLWEVPMISDDKAFPEHAC